MYSKDKLKYFLIISVFKFDVTYALLILFIMFMIIYWLYFYVDNVNIYGKLIGLITFMTLV